MKDKEKRVKKQTTGSGLLRRRLRELEEREREYIDAIESQRLFSKAFETMQLGVTIADLKGRIIFTNQAEADMHGYETEELIGQDVRIFAPQNLWHPMTAKQVASMKRWKRESTNKHKDGTLFPVQLMSDVVTDLKGRPVGVITTCEDITERKRLEEKLHAFSYTDELTGLYNRRGFFALAHQHLKLAKRQKTEIYILYADLDNLKKINDTFGHQVGDLALVDIANIFRSTFRESDLIARIGGDEFVVFLIEIIKENIEIVMARLKKNLKNYNRKAGSGYSLSISTGMTWYDPEHPCSIDELLAQGDRLMYEQKRKKHNAPL